MTSDLNPVSRHPYFARMREELSAIRRWTEANPELAADWDEALYLEDERRADERRRWEDQEIDRALPAALERAGVPKRCVEMFPSLFETTATAALEQFEWDGPTFCLLMGAAGAGKSLAAANVVRGRVRGDVRRNRFRPRLSACFLRAADMARMSAYGKEAEERIEHYCSVELLVLDDLGVERASDMWLTLLDELIDRRYGDRLKTIITTNLDAAAFKARYGERIADRIRHDGVVVGAGSESLRTKGKP